MFSNKECLVHHRSNLLRPATKHQVSRRFGIVLKLDFIEALSSLIELHAVPQSSPVAVLQLSMISICLYKFEPFDGRYSSLDPKQVLLAKYPRRCRELASSNTRVSGQ